MKDKLLKLASKIDVSIISFMLLTCRIVIYGATIGDALAMFALAGVYGFHKYLYRRNELWNMSLETKINKVEKDIESVSHKINSKVLYETAQKKPVRRY